jgi:hypothetical protein
VGLALFKPSGRMPIMMPMNAHRTAIAGKPQPLGAGLSPRDVHLRQLELVRASLVCRPSVKGSTHRRWA